ncbi:MAG: hypothetical protein GY861_08635 [bacterium]|nr:hypothetical protein [bacterium]
MKKKISITIDDNVLKDIDSIVDNIYIRNRSQAIEYLAKNSLGENKKAVILFGGEEKGLKVSDKDYRITAPVKKTTVIEIALKKLRKNGFKEVFIVARHNVLTKIFDIVKEGAAYDVKVNYIEEKTSNGTAESLRLLKGMISSNFLVVYGDILFDKINLDELWNHHLKQNAIASLVLTTAAKPSEKGTVKVEGTRILEFMQRPRETDIYLVFSPIFVAEPSIFNYTGKSLEYDIFPRLAQLGLLQGHISSEKEVHIHSIKDARNQ